MRRLAHRRIRRKGHAAAGVSPGGRDSVPAPTGPARRKNRCSIATAGIVLLAACADGTERPVASPTPAATGTSTATATSPTSTGAGFPTSLEGCTVLTAADAGALMGTAVEESEEKEPGKPVTVSGGAGQYFGYGCVYEGPLTEYTLPGGSGGIQPRAELDVSPGPSELGPAPSGDDCRVVAEAAVLGRSGRVTQCGEPGGPVETVTVEAVVENHLVQLSVNRLAKGGPDDVVRAAQSLFDRLEGRAGSGGG